MTGEVLSRHQDRILRIGMRACDIGMHKIGDFTSVFAVGSNVDDRVVGIIVDVRNRCEQPLDTHGASVARRLAALIARAGKILRGGECHVVRPGRCGSDSHGRAPLKIGAHQQRHLGHFL